MDCKTVLNYLDLFRTGELEGPMQTEIDRHLDDCPECSEDLSRLKVFSQEALRLPASAPAAIAEAVAAKTGDRYGRVETDLGPVWVVYTSKGIAMIVPVDSDGTDFELECQTKIGRRPRPSAVPERYARLVGAAAAGRTSTSPPVDLSWLSEFQQDVLRLLQRIPRGEVRPYSWIAREAGRPRAVRAAASVIARNPMPFLIPCHRVVPLNGGVGNYAFGATMKSRLLSSEGVAVDELEKLARQGVRFIGSDTTKIYCFPSCKDARRITAPHRVVFRDEEAAEQQGYRPCRHCRPVAC